MGDVDQRRCIVFDLDDTLFLERDYVRSGFDAVGEWARRRLAVDDLAEHCWARFEAGHRGRIFDESLAACGVEPTPALVAELVDVYRHHRPAIELLPDARACIDTLRRRGDVLAVVTDGPLAAQRRKAEALGVAAWADVVVFTDAFGPGFGKPHCRAFATVEAHSGLRGSTCTYVADNTAKDFAGPKSLDWRTVRVRRPLGLHHARPSPAEVDTEVCDLSGLEGWFSGPGARPGRAGRVGQPPHFPDALRVGGRP